MRFTPQLRDLAWLVRQPIAHRGLHNEKQGLVENCESSFAAAIDHGFSIETDIQLTQDGEAVVFHDDDVARVLDGQGKAKDLSLRQLKAMKYKQGKDRIQTLGELLEQVDGQSTLVIEIKSLWDDDTTLTDRAVKVLSQYHGPFALMSFDPDLIARVAATADHFSVNVFRMDAVFHGRESVFFKERELVGELFSLDGRLASGKPIRAIGFLACQENAHSNRLN